MVIRLKFLIIVLALLVNNCAYEKINTPGQKVIFIQEINIEGDKKAAFLMKRNLLRASNIKSENKIIIDMVLDNRTSIKEYKCKSYNKRDYKRYRKNERVRSK